MDLTMDALIGSNQVRLERWTLTDSGPRAGSLVITS
jgi:hypothetical protein